MFINIENTGKFPLHYFFRLVEHPSIVYMTKLWPIEVEKKKPIITEVLTRKIRKPMKGVKNDKYDASFFLLFLNSTEKMTKRSKNRLIIHIERYIYRSLLEPEKIILGPMTITKLEGNVDVGQMDSIAINCYPEFVGSQDEQIVLVVPDTIPEDKDGKIITLTVTSSIPCIDFHNFDAMFHENHVVERIQDFEYSNDVRIGHRIYSPYNRSRKCAYYTEFVA